MSSRRTEKEAETTAQAAEKTAQTEKTEARKPRARGAQVYCGPTVRGVAKQYTVYAGELPEELTSTRVGAILDKVAAGVSAIVQGTAMLTLSQETRDIRGGCILKNQNVEVNCAFETLVRLQRAETAGAVAKRLFPEA